MTVGSWEELCPALKGYWDEDECGTCWGCLMFEVPG